MPELVNFPPAPGSRLYAPSFGEKCILVSPWLRARGPSRFSCHSPPGSSVHGISQARMLEWVPFPSPGDLPDPGIEPTSPALTDRLFTISTTWEAQAPSWLQDKYSFNNSCLLSPSRNTSGYFSNTVSPFHSLIQFLYFYNILMKAATVYIWNALYIAG